MTTYEFIEYAVELGFFVEDDKHSLTIWITYGNNGSIKNKVAWVNKVSPLNFKVLSVLHPNKEALVDVLVQYAKTTKGRRGNQYRYKQIVD